MRQYDDPVEVRRGEAEDPDQFLWRGRLWKVRAVVAHWMETGPWSQDRPDDMTDMTDMTGDPAGSSAGGSSTDLSAERELWRVEAGRGIQPGIQPGLRMARDDQDAPETYGVFDLSFDWTDGRWQLVGCRD